MPDVIERADVRMIQRGNGMGLAVKAFAELRVAGHVRRQDFDRDRAIETGIPRFVDFAHPAGAERRDDFIRTQTRAAR
jgi:hypothetical protein